MTVGNETLMKYVRSFADDMDLLSEQICHSHLLIWFTGKCFIVHLLEMEELKTRSNSGQNIKSNALSIELATWYTFRLLGNMLYFCLIKQENCRNVAELLRNIQRRQRNASSLNYHSIL